jgi:hypothetical protein
MERLQEELTRIFKDENVADEKVIDFLQVNDAVHCANRHVNCLLALKVIIGIVL